MRALWMAAARADAFITGHFGRAGRVTDDDVVPGAHAHDLASLTAATISV
jgi:hypothetical protein